MFLLTYFINFFLNKQNIQNLKLITFTFIYIYMQTHLIILRFIVNFETSLDYQITCLQKNIKFIKF